MATRWRDPAWHNKRVLPDNDTRLDALGSHRGGARLLDFSRRLIRIWKDNPVLRRRKFLQGRRIRGADVTDISWLDASGVEMTDETWNAPHVRTLGMRLNGDAIDEANERGERVIGDTLLVIFNAGTSPEPFVLPEAGASGCWESVIDTADPWIPARRLREGNHYELQPHSMAVLRLQR